MTTKKVETKKPTVAKPEIKNPEAEKVEAKKPEEVKESLRPVRKPKELTAVEIQEDWASLIRKTILFEAQQKLSKRPFRHILMARRQLEVRLNQFKRNSR